MPSRLLGSIISVLLLFAVMALATPASADTIPTFYAFQGTIDPFQTGFSASFWVQAKGVAGVFHWFLTGPSKLPSCPTPCLVGSMFDPSATLSFYGYSGTLQLSGKPFKIPAGLFVIHHVNVSGLLTRSSNNLAIRPGFGLNLVLQFSRNSNGTLNLQSEEFIVVPEPDTLTLCACGLTLFGCLGIYKTKFFPGTRSS